MGAAEVKIGIRFTISENNSSSIIIIIKNIRKGVLLSQLIINTLSYNVFKNVSTHSTAAKLDTF